MEQDGPLESQGRCLHLCRPQQHLKNLGVLPETSTEKGQDDKFQMHSSSGENITDLSLQPQLTAGRGTGQCGGDRWEQQRGEGTRQAAGSTATATGKRVCKARGRRLRGRTDRWTDGRMDDEWMDEACSGSTGTQGSRDHSSNTGIGHNACAVSSAWVPLTAGGAGVLGGLP